MKKHLQSTTSSSFNALRGKTTRLSKWKNKFYFLQKHRTRPAAAAFIKTPLCALGGVSNGGRRQPIIIPHRSTLRWHANENAALVKRMLMTAVLFPDLHHLSSTWILNRFRTVHITRKQDRVYAVGKVS